MKKKYFRIFKIFALVYGLLGICLYYLQDSILFHPTVVAQDQSYNFPFPYREVNIPYDPETTLNLIQFTTTGVMIPKGVVLYFHGNRKNISWYAHFAPNFTSSGYEVWMVDYPGFGKSRGKFTEERLYAYALQVYKLARIRYMPSQIILYGKSMGTGIASQLAAERDCKYLLLETPYYSMSSLVAYFAPVYPISSLIHYHFPTYKYLQQVTAPVVIFHGTSDGMIPYRNAKRLLPFLKPHDQFVSIEGGSHNDLSHFAQYKAILDSLLKK